MTLSRLHKIVLLNFILILTIIFLFMIRKLLLVTLLSAIAAAMLWPLSQFLQQRFRFRKSWSCTLLLLMVVVMVVFPLAALFGIIVAEAISIGESAAPWIQQQIAEQSSIDAFFRQFPFYEAISPYKAFILEKGGELVSKISNLLVNTLSAFTISTVNAFFLFFVFLYSLFFFLKDGDQILNKVLYYLPLDSADKQKILARFTSVTRATLKGTLVVGILQGSLNGLIFGIFGIKSALFWGAVMSFLSVIPMVGSPLVWIPAILIEFAYGHWLKALGLWIFCGLLVGSLDNLLRPRLVGKDTKMHELIILLSTLGGIGLFGIIGIVIGPLIAALFVTIWEIYGETFKDYLTSPFQLSSGSESSAPTDMQSDTKN